MIVCVCVVKIVCVCVVKQNRVRTRVIMVGEHTNSESISPAGNIYSIFLMGDLFPFTDLSSWDDLTA